MKPNIKPESAVAAAVCLWAAFIVIGLYGCTTNQQKIALNTLGTLEQTTTAAVDAYDSLVIKGTVPTNDVPRVSKAYNTFQASMLVALDAVQFNTNAVSPPSLVVESQDVINLITTIEKGH